MAAGKFLAKMRGQKMQREAALAQKIERQKQRRGACGDKSAEELAREARVKDMQDMLQRRSGGMNFRQTRALAPVAIKAEDLPNPHLLEAGDNLKSHDYIISDMTDYPGDTDNKRLDKLVLAKEGFEAEAPHRLRVCAESLRDLSRGDMPYAALPNGLWIGDFPEHLKNATFVEMAAASPVRNSGMVIALEQMKVGNIIPGSAQRMMRGTFTTFFQNGHSVQDALLPTLEADIAGFITCALVGARRTDAQLRRLLGARRSRKLELMEFQRDRENNLAGELVLSNDLERGDTTLCTACAPLKRFSLMTAARSLLL